MSICMILIVSIAWTTFYKSTIIAIENVHLNSLAAIMLLAITISILIIICHCGCRISMCLAFDAIAKVLSDTVQHLTMQIAVIFYISSFLIYYASTLNSACTPEMFAALWLFTLAIIIIVIPIIIGWYFNELLLNAMWGAFLCTMAIAILLQSPLQLICLYTIQYIIDISIYRTVITPAFRFEGE